MKRAKITGIGKYVPPRVVKNQELEPLMDTSDEWIRQRTGIEERRWAEEGMSTTSLGVEAARAALKDAGKTPQDVDAIIFATLSSDFVFPGCGVLAQEMLMPEKFVPAIDIRNQCTGFLYSLSVADAWIRADVYKTVLIIGSEIHSNGIDATPEGRDIGVLFGDGAGAAIVEASDDGSGILTSKLHAEGKYADKLWLQRPSSCEWPRIPKGETVIDKSYFPQMDGKLVFKNAVTRMCEVIMEACADQGMKVTDIDFVLAHQANLRINMMVLEQLGITPEKTLNTLQKYGNTTAATLPIGFEEAKAQGMLKPGMTVAMVAFGSGFTWGATLMKL